MLAVLPGPATALFLHRTAAGLTALLQANRLLFDTLHIGGGIVLAWLGVCAWRSARHGGEPLQTALRGRTPLGVFLASLLSIAANPKAAELAATTR